MQISPPVYMYASYLDCTYFDLHLQRDINLYMYMFTFSYFVVGSHAVLFSIEHSIMYIILNTISNVLK